MTLKKVVRSDDVQSDPRPHHQGMTPAGRDNGATAVEYALMVALIATVIVGSVTMFGLAVAQLFVIPCQALGGCATGP